MGVDGEVRGRITLVAAKLPEVQNNNPKIIIPGNITYADQNSTLGLIGQQDILIPLYSPDTLQINAHLLAQKGHVVRYYYPSWDSEPYRTYAIRNAIGLYGSVITNGVWTFTWVDEGETVISGYRTTETDYNPYAVTQPPPYFPTYGEYTVTGWEEL